LEQDCRWKEVNSVHLRQQKYQSISLKNVKLSSSENKIEKILHIHRKRSDVRYHQISHKSKGNVLTVKADGRISIFQRNPCKQIYKSCDWICRQFPSDKHIPNGKDNFSDWVDTENIAHHFKKFANQGFGYVMFPLLFKNFSVNLKAILMNFIECLKLFLMKFNLLLYGW
jgi:hypothetical protein